MFLTKIWERYFLKEFAKTFFLFLFAFYGLYVLIDYSNHTSLFSHQPFAFTVQYYLHDFIQRADVLIPFALLISTIKTIYNFNSHYELVALLASGIKLKTLLRPFIISALFCTLLMYANFEHFLPSSLLKMKQISDKHSLKKNSVHSAVQHLILEDHTTLIFQNYDSSRQVFEDSYWIRSIDEIYRFKLLHSFFEIPTGQHVDHFIRTETGELVLESSLEEKKFPEMRFNKQTLFETLTPPDEQSISDLKNKFPRTGNTRSEKESTIVTNFYNKLALPWLCLLAVIGPIPYCVRFSRTTPVFLLYAVSIFSLVGFYLLIEASLILGKRQVTSPELAVGVPFLTVSGILLWRFLRLK